MEKPLTTVCNKPAQSNIPTNTMMREMMLKYQVNKCICTDLLSPVNFDISFLQAGISHGTIRVKIVHNDVNEYI